MSLKAKLKDLPVAPGVYIHKNADGKIIYIGKAKSLRSRVRSYFQSRKNMDPKTRRLVAKIVDFEFIVVDTEAEALILESNLIKKHKPRYNVFLKDDKQYPHLKVTDEAFPKAVITRKILKDKAKYYGPFLPAAMAHKTLDLINRTFQLRTCNLDIDGSLDRPCLEYHLKRCLGPCVKGLCKPEEYQQAVDDVLLLLDGKNKLLADDLEKRMWHFAENHKFELAAKYRDLRKTVLALDETQKMVASPDRDVDIFGFYRERQRIALQLFTMREGKIVGRREFFWEDLPEGEFDVSEFLGDVLSQYYSTDYVPLEIHVPEDFEDRETLEEILSERRGRRVYIKEPKRGMKAEMISLVEMNAKIAFERRFRVLMPDMEVVLEDLQEMLELPYFPERIESFDISNISGAENVAGIVSYENGKPDRKNYRRYKIKTVEGSDDYASMREAVFRRYRRILAEDGEIPQLIFIDGGKGQLSAAASAMSELGLDAVPMVGLVKPPKKHNEIRQLIIKGREKEPIKFEPGPPVFRLIQEIRDETHKTAVRYHRKRREIRDFTSELSAIPGIGEVRKKMLLKTFGSIERIAKLKVDDLRPILGKSAANNVFDHFEKQRLLAERAARDE